MTQKRKRHSPDFKAKVAIKALKGLSTAGQLASQFGVHPVQISKWKHQLLDGASSLFSDYPARQQKNDDNLQAKLYEEIGRLKFELDWLKKKLETLP